MPEPPSSNPNEGSPPQPPIPGAGVGKGLDGRPLSTWSVWEVVGIVLLGFFLGTIASIPIFILMGDTTRNGAAGPSELLQGVISDVVMVATLIVWLHRRHPTWWQIIGFPTRKRLPVEIAVGAGLGLVVRFAAGIASALVASTLEHATGKAVSVPEQVRTNMSAPELVLFALYAVVVAPITEELVFRGLLYRSIRDRIGVIAGAVLSAIPFGLIHFIGGQPWQDVLTLQLTMVVTGIGLALIYERRGTLVADIAGHAAFNLLAVILIVSGAAIVPGFLRW